MLPCKLSVAIVIFFCQQKVQKEDDSYKTQSNNIHTVHYYKSIYIQTVLHSRRARSVTALVWLVLNTIGSSVMCKVSLVGCYIPTRRIILL